MGRRGSWQRGGHDLHHGLRVALFLGMDDRSRFRLVRLALTRHHRFRRYRLLAMSLSVATLLAVPLSGLARVDLWNGSHLFLNRPATLTKGLGALAVAVVGFYAATFIINMVAGRVFCGFGCPVGQLSRFADAIDAHSTDAAAKRRSWLVLIAFATTLAFTAVFWVVSPRVFVSGELRAIGVTLGTVASIALYAVLHARIWRWQFCRKLCPIGLYYSVVQTGALVAIDFDATAACTECESCRGICPVGLDPRRLGESIPAPGGLSVGGMPANNHCLRCGACVEICEHMMRKQPGTPALGFR